MRQLLYIAAFIISQVIEELSDTLLIFIFFIEDLPTAVNILLIVVIFAVNGAFFATWLALLLKEYKKEIFKKFFKKNQQVGIALAIFGKSKGGKSTASVTPISAEISKICKEEEEIEKGEPLEGRPLTPVFNLDEPSSFNMSPPTRSLVLRPLSRNRIIPISPDSKFHINNDNDNDDPQEL